MELLLLCGNREFECKVEEFLDKRKVLCECDAETRTDVDDVFQEAHEAYRDVVFMRLRCFNIGPIENHICDFSALVGEVVRD